MREGRVGRAVFVKTAENRRERVVVAVGVEGLWLSVRDSLLCTPAERMGVVYLDNFLNVAYHVR